MTLDYFYGNQSEQFTFYRIPKLLFTDPELKNISTEAKVLYGLLLDRMSLSIKNNWLDEQRRVFIIFTIDEIMEALACAEQKAAKLLNELEKGVGLIERKRQGLGKPNLIYVKNFVDKSTVPVRPYIESQILNCENHNSGSAIITDQELPESQTNNTEINNTDSSDTDINPIPSSLVQRLRQKDSMRSDLMEERNRTREYLEEQKACVDMDYMAALTGKDEEALAEELCGVIFPVPNAVTEDGKTVYQTADEYLSGNVRTKLREAERAAAENTLYNPNVEALRSAQPKDLDASEIDIRLGATWVDKEYIEQFMFETFKPPRYAQWNMHVNYSPFTAEWNIQGKNQCSYNDVNAYVTFGTQRANAYRILEDTLNLRDVRIYDTVQDPDGKERRVLNSKETTLAQQKQQAIKDAFQEWIWRDPDRRQTLVARYNEIFNSNRPREYDGQHIKFSGMNPEIQLREHQLNAVAHILYGGNTLLAHEVGAGKTFEMVAAAMESKRLGLCQKSMFVVPNHLTEQWASEFLRLYPSANILVATKKDFETQNRKKFCARIATGDYDAVVIGHSQFERIPVSQERQETVQGLYRRL